MTALMRFVLDRGRQVTAVWMLVLACAAPFAARLPSVIHGGTDTIRVSESGEVTAVIDAKFGRGAGFRFAVLLTHPETVVDDAEFRTAANQAAAALAANPRVKAVAHYWNTGMPELIGRDRGSALLLVTPAVDSYFEAEELTASLRASLRGAITERGYSTAVTGAPAMFYDLTRNSSNDLLRAERIGIPVTLLILLAVFRAPLAAVLPLALAGAAVTLSCAALFLLSVWIPVSVFARNVITMVGLGIGVDYALLLVTHFRQQLARGSGVADAALAASTATAPAILVSGIAVGIGFLALLLVRAPFLHGIAYGGLVVVLSTLVAALSLLPVVLKRWGRFLDWPRRRQAPDTAMAGAAWGRWSRRVMERPWRYLVAASIALVLIAWPALRMQSRNVSMGDMPPEFEARQGFESLHRNFVDGWMGPVILLLQAREAGGMLQPEAQQAVLAITSRLSRDPRVTQVHGYPRLLLAPQEQAGTLTRAQRSPAPPSNAASDSISADGSTALVILVPHAPPERSEVLEFVRQLRADTWPEARAAGIAVKVGGAAAMIADFDAELFGSLWRIVPAVMAVTFAVLLFAFRSILIPIKAIVLNLLSVLAAYGFLVLVFQHGLGAELIGIDTPGGLNSLVVLMLFTILFGLSMDYEVFLLRQIQLEYQSSGDNRLAVASGVERSAGVITSAALIMVCLFGSFGFTQLTATREFGLGLAFAVALDATLVRLVIVPAMMELFGAANWWCPGGKRHLVSHRWVLQRCSNKEGVQP